MYLFAIGSFSVAIQIWMDGVIVWNGCIFAYITQNLFGMRQPFNRLPASMSAVRPQHKALMIWQELEMFGCEMWEYAIISHWMIIILVVGWAAFSSGPKIRATSDHFVPNEWTTIIAIEISHRRRFRRPRNKQESLIKIFAQTNYFRVFIHRCCVELCVCVACWVWICNVERTLYLWT